MSLPRKHIAEGIAAAIMIGVGGTDGRLFADVAKLSAVEPSAKQRLAAMVAGRRSTGGRNITLSAIREALGPLVQVPRHADSDPRIDAAIVQQIFDAIQGSEAHTPSPLMVFSEEPIDAQGPIRIHERTSNAGDGSGLTLTSKHGRCYEVEPIPVAARLVETTRPARRCCAPGCGDKIKDGETYEITWSDGALSYLESCCVDWFVNGHPDYGCSNGPVEGLSL